VIQFTDHCNADCRQCGMRRSHSFPRSRLSLDRIKGLIDQAAASGIQVLSFTGGEPLLFMDDLTAAIHHASAAGIRYIRTGTNGFFLKNPQGPDFDHRVGRVIEALAGTSLRNFWISIDSADPAVHEKNRGLPGVTAGMEKALDRFHQAGLYPSANVGLNRFIQGPHPLGMDNGGTYPSRQARAAFARDCRNALRAFYRRVIDLGFTMVNACYPMSLDAEESPSRPAGASGMNAVYEATSTDAMVDFTPLEKTILFQSLADVLPEFRPRIRVFSPRSSLRALVRSGSEWGSGAGRAAYPCRGGVDYFFIDAQKGRVFPCGYRGGEDLGSLVQAVRNPSVRLNCRRCEWECFRDPSEWLGPLLELKTAPWRLIRRWRKDPDDFKTWWEDWRYARAAGFFNGRRPPEHRRLAKWAPTGLAADPA
jgi:MoaA/NifB/PqqE/SkfB family radical SAM enzyme